MTLPALAWVGIARRAVGGLDDTGAAEAVEAGAQAGPFGAGLADLE